METEERAIPWWVLTLATVGGVIILFFILPIGMIELIGYNSARIFGVFLGLAAYYLWTHRDKKE